MSLKDKMLGRRDALIRDRADCFKAIEEHQAKIAELERLGHTQFGAIQDVQHWLAELEVEEKEQAEAFQRMVAENSDDPNAYPIQFEGVPTDIERLLNEAHETHVKLDEAIAAAEAEGMVGGIQLVERRAELESLITESFSDNDFTRQAGDDLRKAQAS